ncbi:MAG: DUF1003 domain-containing protein [Gemmatimonadaceae bacterium]
MNEPPDEVDSNPPLADEALEGDRRLRRVGLTRAFLAIKAQHAAELTTIQWLADRLTLFASSTGFLIFHIVWFVTWIAWNTGLLPLEPFDPFPFGLLTMVVSLEAIFLSIFVLMGQRREAAIAELREEVTLNITLRIEDETTKLLQLMAGLYARLGHKVGEDAELREMLQPLDISRVEQDLIDQIRSVGKRRPRR